MVRLIVGEKDWDYISSLFGWTSHVTEHGSFVSTASCFWLHLSLRNLIVCFVFVCLYFFTSSMQTNKGANS